MGMTFRRGRKNVSSKVHFCFGVDDVFLCKLYWLPAKCLLLKRIAFMRAMLWLAVRRLRARRSLKLSARLIYVRIPKRPQASFYNVLASMRICINVATSERSTQTDSLLAFLQCFLNSTGIFGSMERKFCILFLLVNSALFEIPGKLL